MLTAIKGILGSKKFWMTVVGSAVTGALTYFHAPADIIHIVGGLFGLGVVGQGIADIGKSAAQISSDSQSQPIPGSLKPITPSK